MDILPPAWKSRFLTGLGLAAAGLLFLSGRTTVPVLLWYGLMILGGAGFVLFGLSDISHGLARHRVERDVDARTFIGLGDLLWGALQVLVGFVLFGGALVLWMHLDEPLLGFLGRRPGPALLVAGLAFITYGLSNFLRSIQEESTLKQFVSILPHRMFQLIVTTLGAMLLLVGLWELVTPAAFDATLAGWLEPFLILFGQGPG